MHENVSRMRKACRLTFEQKPGLMNTEISANFLVKARIRAALSGLIANFQWNLAAGSKGSGSAKHNGVDDGSALKFIGPLGDDVPLNLT